MRTDINIPVTLTLLVLFVTALDISTTEWALHHIDGVVELNKITDTLHEEGYFHLMLFRVLTTFFIISLVFLFQMNKSERLALTPITTKDLIRWSDKLQGLPTKVQLKIVFAMTIAVYAFTRLLVVLSNFLVIFFQTSFISLLQKLSPNLSDSHGQTLSILICAFFSFVIVMVCYKFLLTNNKTHSI